MDGFPQHVRRNLHVDGTRSGAIAHGCAHRLVQITQQVICHPQRPGQARDGLQDVRVRHALQWPQIVLGARSAAADQSTGTRSNCALAMAVTQLVTPGPAVTRRRQAAR